MTDPPNDKRPVWEDIRQRPEQQTLKAKFCRHAFLFIFGFLWICGIIFVVDMWCYSFYTIVQTALTMGATPVPMSVKVYIAICTVYYSYHIWMLRSDEPKGWAWFRNVIHKNMADYPYFRHQICIVEGREVESLENPQEPMFPPEDKSMFLYHPHGVLSVGWAVNGTQSLRFKNADPRWLVAESVVWIPLLRELMLWLNFDTVHRDTFIKHMKVNRNLCLIPGGFEEATIYKRGEHRVYIKKRFGFIKLALQYGYKLHPVYSFGEEETYRTFYWFIEQRLMLNVYKIPGVIFFGAWWCFFMPHSEVDMTTIIGKPLQLPKIENPTKEDVAKYHKLYMDTLVDLFDRHKSKYATDPNAKLQLF